MDPASTIDAGALWRWLPVGYVLTVALEAPVLLLGLGRWPVNEARRYTYAQRLAAAFWLTAVTYPIVIVALPLLMWPHASHATYVLVAEAWAIAAECALFRVVWRGSPQDLAIVALANVVSAMSGGWFLSR